MWASPEPPPLNSSANESHQFISLTAAHVGQHRLQMHAPCSSKKETRQVKTGQTVPDVKPDKPPGSTSATFHREGWEDTDGDGGSLLEEKEEGQLRRLLKVLVCEILHQRSAFPVPPRHRSTSPMSQLRFTNFSVGHKNL